jgi:uncharacterized protein YndB with AHSA1/START domain
MNSNITIKKDIQKHEITLQRTLKGPQEIVWRCLTSPKYIDQWWGPEGWATETKTMNVKPGGIWHYRMHGDGREVWGLAKYEEVENPSRIVYTESASSAAGEKQTGRQQYVTIGLAPETNAHTTISIHTRFASQADLEAMVEMAMVEGYGGALDKLEAIIRKEQHGAN